MGIKIALGFIAVSILLILMLIMRARKQKGKKSFQKRVAECFNMFASASANALRDHFVKNKWYVPTDFTGMIAEMLEEGLLSHPKDVKSKHLMYELTESGKNLLPKPKAVASEVPIETQTFDAAQFTKK